MLVLPHPFCRILYHPICLVCIIHLFSGCKAIYAQPDFSVTRPYHCAGEGWGLLPGFGGLCNKLDRKVADPVILTIFFNSMSLCYCFLSGVQSHSISMAVLQCCRLNHMCSSESVGVFSVTEIIFLTSHLSSISPLFLALCGSTSTRKLFPDMTLSRITDSVKVRLSQTEDPYLIRPRCEHMLIVWTIHRRKAPNDRQNIILSTSSPGISTIK